MTLSPALKKKEDPSAKGTDTEAESETGWALSLLRSDLQHTDACKVSLLCGLEKSCMREIRTYGSERISHREV